jgi:hypothetical protein
LKLPNIIVCLRVLLAWHEAIVVLVVWLCLVEWELVAVHNVDEFFAQGVRVVSLTGCELNLASAGLLETGNQRTIHASGKTDQAAVLTATIAFVRSIAVFVKEREEISGEVGIRRFRDFHADDLAMTKLSIVWKSAKIVIADFVRCIFATGIPSEGSELLVRPRKILTLGPNKLVHDVPEATGPKININQLISLRGLGHRRLWIVESYISTHEKSSQQS